MLSFKPTPKLENELKTVQGLMAEKCKEMESLSPGEGQYLHKYAFISTIGASTRIENAVLTDSEVEWVDTRLEQDGKTTSFDQQKEYIINKLSKDRERSIEEVVGCRQILSIIYIQAEELFPLTETIIRGLYHDLLRFYPEMEKYAGAYKTTTNRVIYKNHETGEQRVVLNPSPPGMITETAMNDLLKWYNSTIQVYPWPLLIASEFVFRFLAIHPFQDGNGRLGRALFILALLQSNDNYLKKIIPYISLDRHIEQNRSLYYTVLHQCSGGNFSADSSNYKLEPLAWFFLKIFKSSFSDIDIYRSRYMRMQNLSESAIEVLNCFKINPEKRLKVADIMNDITIPRRTVQYALQTLVKAEFLHKLGQGAGTRYQLVF